MTTGSLKFKKIGGTPDRTPLQSLRTKYQHHYNVNMLFLTFNCALFHKETPCF